MASNPAQAAEDLAREALMSYKRAFNDFDLTDKAAAMNYVTAYMAAAVANTPKPTDEGQK